MRLRKHDYDTCQSTPLTEEEFNDLLNDFDREISIVDVGVRVEYARLNPQDDGINETVRELDTTRTVVFHFDSDFDIYVEA